MEFLPESIEAYAERFTQAESEVLSRLNRETYTKVMIPRMLSGHLQGQVLSMFSKMIRPKRILEIGTYTGYSAICLAQGLQEGGELHTIDVNAELEDMIRKYLEEANLSNSVHLHIANAVDKVNELDGPFDIVFIDADKENYSHYFDLVMDKVSPGGYIIADNVLWSGKVVKPTEKNDTETEALKAYAEKIHADERVENLLLPVRDGLLIARKLP